VLFSQKQHTHWIKKK